MTLPAPAPVPGARRLLGSIYVVQNFDAVFTITSGGLGTANLPYTIYQTFYNAHDYGRASAAGVVVVIGTIIIATFALRTVSSLFKEEAADDRHRHRPGAGDPHRRRQPQTRRKPRGGRAARRRSPGWSASCSCCRCCGWC